MDRGCLLYSGLWLCYHCWFFCECINDVRKKCSCGQYCLMTTQEKQTLCCKLYVWLTMQNSASIFLSYCDLYVFLYSIASCGSVLIRVTKGLTLTVLWSPVILLMFQWWKHLFFIFCIIRHCRKKSHCSATTTNKAAALGVCLMWLLQPIPVARARRVAIETKFWPIMLKLPLIPWLATGSWQQEVKHHWLLYENGKIVF